MLNYLICAVICIMVPFFLEQLLKPAIQWPWRRHYSTILIHMGLCLLFFNFILLFSHRVYFATFCTLTFFLLLVLVGNAKYASLREPFVFQDLGYISEVIKHPRFYLPLFGIVRLILLVGLIFAIIYLDITFETPLLKTVSSLTFYLIIALSFLFASVLLAIGYFYTPAATFDPTIDLLELGFLSSLFLYGIAEYEKHDSLNAVENFQGNPSLLRPNLLVVQNESFFDVRPLFSGISREVLANFDEIKKSSVLYGRVEVPAWGANTVRTEFSFLSGVNLNNLGVHKFNPYRKMVTPDIITLASDLRRLGYRTVCVHPFSEKFYSRHKIYPLMGFDEFIDIRQFSKEDYFGPYISDLAVAEKVSHLFDAYTDQPLFIFVITMEKHGPLHLEYVDGIDEEKCYKQPPPKGCKELTSYVSHLSNADKMIGVILQKLKSMSKDSFFCWYGDHVPNMANVYSILTVPDGKTDYFLWSSQNKTNNNSVPKNISINELSYLIKLHMFYS